jgi:hypothetical protein
MPTAPDPNPPPTAAPDDIELFTKPARSGTEIWLHNNNTRKTVRVTLRSLCHNPRMNVVSTYDVFPRQDRRIATDSANGPSITRTIESAAYAPPPGRSKDQ